MLMVPQIKKLLNKMITDLRHYFFFFIAFELIRVHIDICIYI